jgi:hypothetical protein
MGFGTIRMMAWVSSQLRCPHYVLEMGLIGPDSAQGTLSLSQRADLVLDSHYLELFYNTSGFNVAPSFNDVYNRCAGYQAPELGSWRHYQVPQCDMKPVIANSISYSFSADEKNIATFADAAEEIARLWAVFVAGGHGGPPSSDSGEASMLGAYDARYAEAVRADPGNAIAAKLFGEAATQALLGAMIGPGL